MADFSSSPFYQPNIVIEWQYILCSFPISPVLLFAVIMRPQQSREHPGRGCWQDLSRDLKPGDLYPCDNLRYGVRMLEPGIIKNAGIKWNKSHITGQP